MRTSGCWTPPEDPCLLSLTALEFRRRPSQIQALVVRGMPVCMGVGPGSSSPGSSLNISANCFFLRPRRAGPCGLWPGRAAHGAFPRAGQLLRVGGWTQQGLCLRLLQGQERLHAHSEPGPLSLPPFLFPLPHLLISPLALERSLRESGGTGISSRAGQPPIISHKWSLGEAP